MTVQKIFEGTKKLVLKKMENNNSCMLTHKDGTEYFFSRGTDGYTLYKGCDLVIGDCTLDQCVAVLVALKAS